MVRIASRLSLILLAYFCFQPLVLAQETAPTVETALRGVVEEFFSAYAKEDLEKFIGLWSVNSPELQSRRKVMQELFAANETIEVKSLTISKVKVESEKASMRVAFEITARDVKTSKPAQARENEPRVGVCQRERHVEGMARGGSRGGLCSGVGSGKDRCGACCAVAGRKRVNDCGTVEGLEQTRKGPL